MKIRKLVLLCFVFTTYYTYSQNQIITTPRIASPEHVFLSIFQGDKLSNPIFLNGKVKTVHRIVTNYVTPNRKEKSKKSFSYQLNHLKQAVKYASDVEFDEMSPEFLNLEQETIITGDTLINHYNNWYTFKNGQLVTKKEKTEETIALDVFIDSTSSVSYTHLTLPTNREV